MQGGDVAACRRDALSVQTQNVHALKRIGVCWDIDHYVIFSLVHLNNSPEKYGASNITLAASKY